MSSTLKTARVNAGLSLEALAQRTGLALRTVIRVENHESWSRGSVALIARELGVPFDAVIEEYEGHPAPPRARVAATTEKG